jgi:hypothetical protein
MSKRLLADRILDEVQQLRRPRQIVAEMDAVSILAKR